jgi:hypothetical protein
MLLVFLSLLFSVTARTQTNCAVTLQEARKQYDLGMIDEIPGMLGPCIQDGFTRAQRIEAYKLLILVYLFDDEQFEAEKTMLEFLKKYPEYEIMPNDPVEFVYLFESYRTTSVFSIGLTLGFNLTDPRIMEPYSMMDKSTSTFINEMGTGFQIGLGAGRYLGKRLMLQAELQYNQQQYSFTDKSSVIKDDGTSFNESCNFDEQIRSIHFPVSFSFELNDGKLLYFLRAGGYVDYVLAASGTPTRTINDQPLPGENTDILEFRNNLLFGALMGAGIRYKIPRGSLSADFRFNMGLNNITSKDMRFNNTYLSGMFNHLDDDFSLNKYTLSIGYYFSFYSPKKQK